MFYNKKYLEGLYFTVFVLYFLCSCQYLYSQTTGGNQQTLSPIITLIGTIGSDDVSVPQEYLLVMPRFPAVKNNGDILIPDEFKIKVFDSSLKPKKIFGGQGQGPGEFEFATALRLAPNGYLTVSDEEYYSLFDDNYKFISKNRFYPSANLTSFLKSKDIEQKSLSPSITMLNTHAMVYYIAVNNNNNELFYILLYEDGAKFIPIAFMENLGRIKYKNGSYSLFNYTLYSCVLSDSVVVYMRRGRDDVNFISDTKGEYTVHYYNFIKEKDETVSYPFRPIVLTKELINEGINSILRGRNDEDLKDILDKEFKKQKYDFPVMGFKLDGEYLYIFYYTSIGKEPSLMMMQVIDTKTKKIVYQGESPFASGLPNIIKNGIAFTYEKDKNGFTVCRLYKIHPAVYGKK